MREILDDYNTYDTHKNYVINMLKYILSQLLGPIIYIERLMYQKVHRHLVYTHTCMMEIITNVTCK